MKYPAWGKLELSLKDYINRLTKVNRSNQYQNSKDCTLVVPSSAQAIKLTA